MAAKFVDTVKGHNETVMNQHREAKKLIEDRKSTRLNSSHGYISYAVFCLKKKKKRKEEEKNKQELKYTKEKTAKEGSHEV